MAAKAIDANEPAVAPILPGKGPSYLLYGTFGAGA